jgi:hypothetical protein
MSTIDSLTPQQAVLLARLVVPVRPDISPEVARYLSQLHFDEIDLQQMNELAAKSRAGTLTEKEQQVLDDYEQVGLILERIKSEARQHLRQMP